MKIIVFEGLDKSGKYSQSELLKKNLEELGYKVAKSEFHRYDTPTGQLIQKWLYGEYDVDQTTIELIMAADKYAQVPWMNSLRKEGYDFLILDRYYTSQIVYGRASGGDVDWIDGLIGDLPAYHLQFFLDISPEESMRRKGKHGENDRYESDLTLLKKVREWYLHEVEFQGDIKLINAERSVEQIENEVLLFMKSWLELNQRRDANVSC